MLDEQNYETFDEFLVNYNLTMASYLNAIRATLRRPTVVFKPDFSEMYTNTFNPWIILEEYSCSAYVLEYVNKSTALLTCTKNY